MEEVTARVETTELVRLREDLEIARAEGVKWANAAELEQGRAGAAYSEIATLRAELIAAQAGSARLAGENQRLTDLLAWYETQNRALLGSCGVKDERIRGLMAAVQQERATAMGERDSRIAAEEARAWAEGEVERLREAADRMLAARRTYLTNAGGTCKAVGEAEDALRELIDAALAGRAESTHG